MLDDFFVRALLAGAGMALIAGPLGCLVVWRRLAYFGDTLSHAALLGVALGLLLQVSLTLAVLAVCVGVALVLLVLQRRANLSSDALLGLLSHASLAIGMVVLASMTWVRIDLMGLLFGDILAVSLQDIAIIWIGGGVVLAVLATIWRPLFAATVSSELAEAEGMNPARSNLVFMLLMAVVIAISMKLVGVLLITAMLIIPAATARRFAKGPEVMAVLSALAGIMAVAGGLFGSLSLDLPSGPAIVVAALLLFLVATALPGIGRRKRRENPGTSGGQA